MVEYSFLSTLYNNADRLKVCLDSIINASANLDFEIVIVDNYSTDGSFEILKDYTSLYSNIKVLRRKCCRGLGRQIAFKNSKGRYLITIDMDTEYLSGKLHRFLLAHKKSKIKDMYALKTWGSLCLYPRHIVEKAGGWRDYNIGEDMDILTRLFLAHLIIFMPVNLELNEPYIDRQEKETPLRMLEVFRRERRYAEGLNQIIRTLKNKVDFYCSLGYTLRKLVVRHRYMQIKLYKTFFAGILMLISKIVNIFSGRQITYADPNLSNVHYVFYKSIKNMVNPSEFGLEAEPGPDFLDKHFQFIAGLKPDIIKALQVLYSQDTRRRMQFAVQSAH